MIRKTAFGVLVLLLIFSFAFTACDQDAPMGGWYPSARSYREQDGYAIVEGIKRHYWLYDTYTYHNGDWFVILEYIIPAWVEMMGYVIDYDNVQEFDPNTDLASSVKSLMRQRRCDISVTLVTDLPDYDYLIVNSYDRKSNTYLSIHYPFLEREKYEEDYFYVNQPQTAYLGNYSTWDRFINVGDTAQ